MNNMNNANIHYYQRKQELFLSFDVETDGNNPYQHSMRSIGIAAFVENNITPISTFYCNLSRRQNAVEDKECMSKFWNKRKHLYNNLQTNCSTPEQSMYNLSQWLKKLKSYRICWIASPSNFDWMFLKCYYEKFGPKHKPRIGFFCQDLQSMETTLRLIMNGTNFSSKQFKSFLSLHHPTTHHSLDDAIRQGVRYINVRYIIKQLQTCIKSSIIYDASYGVNRFHVNFAYNYCPLSLLQY